MTVNASSKYPFSGVSLSNTDWENYAGLWRSDGVVRGATNELAVSQRGAGANMSVDVATGTIMLRGHLGAWSTTSNLTIANNASGNPRIDVIVAVLDVTNSNIYLDVVQGTPAVSPSAPALTVSGTLKQVALAYVTVASGAVSIVNANISDRRWPSTGPGLARHWGVTAAATLPTVPETERASSVVLPVTGATAITAIPLAPAGSRLILEAGGAGVNVTAGGTLKMAENWLGDTGATLHFESDGTNWYEVSRAQARGTAAQVLAAPPTSTGTVVLRTLAAEHVASVGIPYPNPVVNPGFEIWQRGTSFTASGYTADRWNLALGGGSTITLTRDSAVTDASGLYAMKCVYVHSGTTFITQDNLEEYAFYRGRTVTFSVRVWCNTALATRIALVTGASGSVTSVFHTGNSAWQTLTASLTIGAAETDIDLGLRLEASCTAYFDNAMFAPVGSAQTFYLPDRATDLARCQRYYEVHGGTNTSMGLNAVATGAGQFIGGPVTYAAAKGGQPTVTKNGTWAVTNTAQPAIANACPNSYEIFANSSGAGVLSFNADSTDDTVTSEWNP